MGNPFDVKSKNRGAWPTGFSIQVEGLPEMRFESVDAVVLSREALDEDRSRLGPVDFKAEYQQNPTPPVEVEVPVLLSDLRSYPGQGDVVDAFVRTVAPMVARDLDRMIIEDIRANTPNPPDFAAWRDYLLDDDEEL